MLSSAGSDGDAAAPASILIVDDNPAKRLSIRATIESLGVRVYEAASGEVALRMVVERPYAVILMDVHMPGMGGYETAQLIRMRKETELTPIVFITADTQDAAQIPLAYASGAVDFIFGTIDTDVLRAKVSVFTDLYCRARGLELSLEDASDAKASLRRASRHFELSGDLVCTVGFDGCLEQVNAVWTSVLGWSGDELRSRPLADFLHPDDRAHTAREWTDLAKSAERTSFTNRFRAKDGPWHSIEWTAGLAPDEDLFYASARDVTKRNQTERRLAGTVSALERSNEDLKKFASTASHDLAEPLRTIAGFAQLLERRFGDEIDARGIEYIHRMVGGVAMMQAILGDMIEFSEAGRDDVPRDRVDTAELVDQILDDHSTAIAEKRAKVAVGSLPTVIGERAQLSQLLGNLIDNAIKFSDHEEPQIEVSAAREPSGWRFSVADGGIGVPDHQRERIFDAFQRLHPRGRYGGTGMGLALCKRVVQHHGGEIRVGEGLGGRGARFQFDIPDPDDRPAGSVPIG